MSEVCHSRILSDFSIFTFRHSRLMNWRKCVHMYNTLCLGVVKVYNFVCTTLRKYNSRWIFRRLINKSKTHHNAPHFNGLLPKCSSDKIIEISISI